MRLHRHGPKVTLGLITAALSGRQLTAVPAEAAEVASRVRFNRHKPGNAWRRGAIAMIAALAGFGGSASDASATTVLVELIFVEQNGNPIAPGPGRSVGNPTVQAAPGDTLKMEVHLINFVPLTLAAFSLRFDSDGQNELDIISANLWTGVPLAGGDSFAPVQPLTSVESTGTAGSIQSFNGVTSNFGLPRTLPVPSSPVNCCSYVMGTVTWRVTSNVASDGDDVTAGLFNAGVDAFADAQVNQITDLEFRSAIVDAVTGPTAAPTATPTETPTTAVPPTDTPTETPTATPTNQPPDCTKAGASRTVLWPPDHTFEALSVVGITDPDGDVVMVRVVGISQDEPLNARGDGNTCPDGTITGTKAFNVRKERSGRGDGRVYHVRFVADDGKQGGTCSGEVGVCVPHDRGRGWGCVDQGMLYDSTACG